MASRSRTGLSLFAAACLSTGCSFFFPPEREYLSNDAVLRATAEAFGFAVDPRLYKLDGLEAREDSVTLQYEGVKRVGDHAWVVRFSEKSTEQDPLALVDVYSLLAVLKEGKPRFAITEEGSRDAGGSTAKFVRYRFESPIRDRSGNPLPAHGIVATFRVEKMSVPLVYQLKLDNHGDRDDVLWDDLRPFIEAMGLEWPTAPPGA